MDPQILSPGWSLETHFFVAISGEISSRVMQVTGLRQCQCNVEKKGGVQTKIREIVPKAIFSPCQNHSLNLCGVHSFSCEPMSVTRFGTVEQLYIFFFVLNQ